MTEHDAPSLVLASGSKTRQELLSSAGITFEVCPADVDEAAIRDRLLADGPNGARETIALALGKAKAEQVSAQYLEHLVIGGDQILAAGDEVFEKPKSVEDARNQLLALRGRTHHLHSSVVIAKNKEIVWQHVATATLTMREFSEVALDAYLAQAGDSVLYSVGAYQIEGPAIQLFEHVDGDYTTILGLPLLPLLAQLRTQKVIPQ